MRVAIIDAPAAGVPRLLVIGGGCSLEVEPGVRAIDQPGFPPQYLAEARAQADALDGSPRRSRRARGAAPLATAYHRRCILDTDIGAARA